MNGLTNFWALCDRSGAVRTDDNGQSLIFESRSVAREYLANYDDYEVLHVEKVEVR